MNDDTEYQKLSRYCSGLQSEWSDLEVRYDKLKKHSQNQRRALRRMNRINEAISKLGRSVPCDGQLGLAMNRNTKIKTLQMEIAQLRASEQEYKFLFYGAIGAALFVWGAARWLLS